MIVTPIAPDPKRDAAAAQLAQTAPWPRVTLNRPVGSFEPGAIFYRVPSSQPGVRYVANAVCCTCPDSQRGGHVCKHSRAVRLAEQAEYEVEQAFADVAAKRQRVVPLKSYSDLFPVGLYD
jgi:hypothetical protein